MILDPLLSALTTIAEKDLLNIQIFYPLLFKYLLLVAFYKNHMKKNGKWQIEVTRDVTKKAFKTHEMIGRNKKLDVCEKRA